jgi:hypothetical protein
MYSYSTSRSRAALVSAIIAAAAITVLLVGSGRGRAAQQTVPAITSAPSISGSAQQSATLVADPGSWSGNPTSYSYMWSRCNRTGNSCSPIVGASGKSYFLQRADVQHTLRVTVTAANGDGSGEATSAATVVISGSAPPTNTAVPTVSGTAQVGSTLAATSGSWAGSPTNYTYAWNRCDEHGASCAAIRDTATQTYQLKQVDSGSTIRVTVSAVNRAGSAEAMSAPTTVVSVVPVTGCPSGTGLVQIADLSSPARLLIDQQTVSPGVVDVTAKTIGVRVRITTCGGRPVQGALVYASPVPYNQYAGPEMTSDANGIATLTLTQRAGFPASPHQERLTVFVRARKAGEPITGGISSRRLVTFPVALHR